MSKLNMNDKNCGIYVLHANWNCEYEYLRNAVAWEKISSFLPCRVIHEHTLLKLHCG